MKKCLIINDNGSDLGIVLESCGAEISRMSFAEAIDADLSAFDSFCVFGDRGVLDPRLRVKLEKLCFEQCRRVFAEALLSWGGVYCAEPADTTSRRLVCAVAGEENGIPGLDTGDLLDDCANLTVRPYQAVPGIKHLLVYGDHIVAHSRWGAGKEEIMKNASPGLWTLGENILMSSFTLHNFNRARFAPSGAWKKVVTFIARWLTGGAPSYFPEPVARYGVEADLRDDAVFEECRKSCINRGINWLKRFLVDGGEGGIREGMRHKISPDGVQATADAIRADCAGEAAGAFRFYGALGGDNEASRFADSLFSFVFGTMTVNGGLFDGMLRWTDTGWCVCYQDDAARAVLPALYECVYLGNDERFPAVCRVLDFLVRTTAKDGCRNARTDAPFLNENGMKALAEAEHGTPSAHYNAYYHAALLLAYIHGGNKEYLDTAVRGLERLMSLYPDTAREQSETEEMCRLILPLSLLYKATGEARHREMLYRVTDDLSRLRHPSGGYREWDTGYKAACSRDSRGECSLLTENGDPVADLLYSVNWLPVGFATAYRVTGDRRFYDLWRDIVSFFIRTQISSSDPKTDGSWCRGFDMDLGEAYGNPHDVGWAYLCSESGWTDAEILMGMMFFDLSVGF